jgi:hypothetical protein
MRAIVVGKMRMRPNDAIRLWLVLSYAALTSANTREVTIHRKKGGKISGSVVRKTDDSISLQLPDGRLGTFPLAESPLLHDPEAVQEEYDRRTAAIVGTDDGRTHLELSRWCLKNGLRFSAQEHSWKAAESNEQAVLGEVVNEVVANEDYPVARIAAERGASIFPKNLTFEFASSLTVGRKLLRAERHVAHSM